MRSRTITALLIILATAGAEAQTYQSALKWAMGEITIEDIIAQSEVEALGSDILSVIKSFHTINQSKKQWPSTFNATALALQMLPFVSPNRLIDATKTSHKEKLRTQLFSKSINIRAPSFYI